MGLTCGCDSDWYPEPGEWYWTETPNGYKNFELKKRKRCSSCNELIDIGSLTTEHKRVKAPDYDVEISIYGEDGEIPIASDWMCEKCSDMYFSLTELGYCVSPRDNMRELVREYAGEHAA
jgi:hypothetical protein